MKISLFAIAGLVASVAADSVTLDVMKGIMKDAVAYHKTLTDWDGSYKSGISLLMETRALVKKIQTAEAHPGLRAPNSRENSNLEEEAVQVANALTKEIGDMVDAAIAKKAQFYANPIIGKKLALSNFQNLRSAASNLGKVLAIKGAEERPDETAKALKDMDDHFARGEAVFKDEL